MSEQNNAHGPEKQQSQTIRPRDFLDKLVDMSIVAKPAIKDFYSESEKSVMSIIDRLLARGIISESNLFSVAKSLSPKIPVVSAVKELKNGTAFLPPYVKESFNAGNDYGFDKLSIAIYDVDHSEGKFYLLVPIHPSEDIMLAVKKFKENSDFLKKDQKVDINGSDGSTYTETRNLSGYGIKIRIAPKSLISEILTSNMRLSDSLKKSHENVRRQAEESGFELGKKSEIIAIEGNIDENKGTIRGDLQMIFTKGKNGFPSSASDIHFEPNAGVGGRIRYRVNGTLTEWEDSPSHDLFVDEIKGLARLKQNIKKTKQDGKISIDINGVRYMYRCSVMPIGEEGKEKIVLRELTNDPSKLNLKKMKMDKRFLDMIYDSVGNPEEGKVGKHSDGMIIVTGPTGSGKSTTLFSMLNVLNTHEVNITTLEDPIEYELPGLNQSFIFDSSGKLSPGKDPNEMYTWETALEAVLRQDPDIVLVGEIRNKETMSLANTAASTGHIVFTSLHTNDTWETLKRIVGLGIEKSTINSTVRLIVAQRLASYVCPYCSKEYNDPSFSKSYEEKSKRDAEYLRRKMEIYTALLDSEYVTELPDNISDLKLYEGAGCSRCNHTGKYSRVGIYEFLPMDLDVQSFIIKNGTEPDAKAVRNFAIEKGIITLYQNAMYKVAVGVTQDSKGQNGEFDVYRMDYGSALIGSGGDKYGFGTAYENIKDIDVLEKMIFIKKKEKELVQVRKEFDMVSYELDGLRKFVGTDGKSASFGNLEAKHEDLKNRYESLEELLKTKKGQLG